MHVLVVKTSSMGDVLHTLPALTDAMRAVPGIRFDWVVEEAFAELPAWHPAVEQVIPAALRRWRKNPFSAFTGGEWGRFKRLLRTRRYDCIIDAQGLIKSAILVRIARGVRCGMDGASAREPLAAHAYERRVPIAKGRHAIERVRELFARALDYPVPEGAPDYGIQLEQAADSPLALSGEEGRGEGAPGEDYLVFLHGTTWSSKHWPMRYWERLARVASLAGYRIRLPWGSEDERAQAAAIAGAAAHADVLPKTDLNGMARVLAGARGAVGVDSGLAHLAAALGVPAVAIYGPTVPGLTGTCGAHQVHACAEFPCAPCLQRTCSYQGEAEVSPACFQSLPPETVWEMLQELLSKDKE